MAGHNNSSSSSSEQKEGGQLATILDFQTAFQAKQEKKVYERWGNYYREIPYQDLLDALVYQHENDFPLRRSDKSLERLQHKALVDVLTEKAQSSFLRELLKEIHSLN